MGKISISQGQSLGSNRRDRDPVTTNRQSQPKAGNISQERRMKITGPLVHEPGQRNNARAEVMFNVTSE
ncbi:MAG TPA: hypothetical protein VFS41_05565 [Edaphobacter sp.]|nr:hypothetical protein [Edaphobacter sp.]